MMTLIQRARDSGVCPPSLIQEGRLTSDDGFEEAVTKVLDSNGGLTLGSDSNVVEDFQKVLEMAELSDQTSKDILEFRRCIILTIVGSTDVNSISLSRVLENGYLTTVKKWFDDILKGSVGGVDLLLHLLTNIKDLPVTKSIVKQSGMGKAIGSIEKHSICAGTPNETAIMDRVHGIKSAWNASVKARKEDKDENGEKTTAKRQMELPETTPPLAKRPKVEEKKKSNAFSSLLKKVSTNSSDKGAFSPETKPTVTAIPSGDGEANPKQGAKKSTKARVKWADHFGATLTASQVIDSTDATSDGTKPDDTVVSWTDRKKRDRLREKELLAKAKKAKLFDDDFEEVESPSRMKPTREWGQPRILPDNPDVTKAQLNSNEVAVQTDRMTKVQPARYVSEDDVPSSPAPLSDVEQALDMTSVSSAVVATIPFFVPQAEPPAPISVAPVPAPVLPPAASYSAPPPQNHIPPVPPRVMAPPSGYPFAAQNGHEAATAQTVQSLGLPLFLVGQNVQALQTLASSPSLLNTLVEPNGMYDQPRLMNLVQTLSQNIPPGQPSPAGQLSGLPGYQPPAPAPAYGGQSYPGGGSIYGPASTSTPSAAFGQPSPSYGGNFSGAGGPSGASGGYRGDNNSDGNLHLSGYGPLTTQSDIIALFAPYVQVDEVVMKGTFSFVNTSDPIGAQNAREALNGALLGGMPIRINVAQRRNREPNRSGFSGPPSRGGGGLDVLGSGAPPPAINQRSDVPPFQKPPMFGGQHEDSVRDDRGNPATKNLFVAGYGPGTTEQQLRDIFGQYATVIGVVTKGTFSFVNTSEKGAAIRSREALSNTNLNGGTLRINFAKETGRLGTSFDLTYGPGTGGPGGGGGHYGRGGY